jgi:uncharacterized protein
MSNPFAVATPELFRHHGTRAHIERRGPLPGLALSAAHLVEGEDVVADLTLEAQGDTLMASGTVTAHWEGECRRCLQTTDGILAIEFREVFQPDPVEGETYPLDRDRVDLRPALREAVALALPVAPLCDEACPGPDPDEHPVTIESPLEELEATPPADPRWAALDQLRFDN